jgi:hypothetical protein
MGISESKSCFVTEIAESLRKYCRDEFGKSNLKRLIKLTAAMAERRLYYRLKVAAKAQESTINRMAISVTANIFSKSGDSTFLKEALKDRLEGDDVSVFNHFQAVVVRSASQELFHRWGENDPMSAKLWRSMQRAIRHDPRLVVFPCDKPAWVALKPAEAKQDLIQIHYDEAVAIVSNQKSPGQSIADLVTTAISFSQEKSQKPCVISIEILFAVLRDMATQEAGIELEERTASWTEDPLMRLAIEKVNIQVSKKIDTRVEEYRKAGKLDIKLVDSFRQALSDLLDDMTDGGPAQGYFQYIQPYQPEMTYERYRTVHRAKFEYLAEIVKTTFIKKMKGFFEN